MLFNEEIFPSYFRVLYKVKSQKLIHQKFISLSQINSDFHANIVFLLTSLES
jgi:hypothetical protein